jgi:hypothetical protein
LSSQHQLKIIQLQHFYLSLVTGLDVTQNLPAGRQVSARHRSPARWQQYVETLQKGLSGLNQSVKDVTDGHEVCRLLTGNNSQKKSHQTLFAIDTRET